MRRGSAPLCAFALALVGLTSQQVSAQRVLGIGDDALVLPRGVLRVRVIGQWTTFNERYGKDTPGRPNGALEPLGIDFDLDTVGVREFPNLTPVQTGLRSLTGLSDFTLSLGQTRVRLNGRVTAIPITIEAGLTKKLSLGLLIPYVKTNQDVGFTVNPRGLEGNVAFNPAFAFPQFADTNRAVVTGLQNAATAVESSLPGGSAFCTANPTHRTCQVIAQVRAFAGGIAQIYGSTSGTGSPFIPIAGTDAQLAIEARVAAFKSLLGAAGGLIQQTRPYPAQARLGLADAQRILTESAFGVTAEPLSTVERSHIGDIELGAKYLFLDTFNGSTEARLDPKGFNYRAALTLAFRAGTGEPDTPTNFADIGTGTGANAVSVRASTDFLFGGHFWTSVIGRYTNQLPDRQTMRIIDTPNRRLAAAWRQRDVDRDLGDFFELEVNPRWVVNDFFSVSSHYLYRHKAEDKYTGTFTVPAATTGYSDVTLNASTLNLETEAREHRLGGGVTFSTVAAFNKGKAKLPMEIFYTHFQTTKGEGGSMPKIFSDQVQLRIYLRIFGGSEETK
jgi:hypothetical protein